jgi:hypothetical protein
MKKVLLLVLVTLSTLCGYSQDTKQLVINTLRGKLKESQFSKKGDYFINVDTVLDKQNQSMFTFVYNEYKTKNEMVANVNQLMSHFGFEGYYNLQEFKNVPIFLSKTHISVLSNKGDHTYLIDWWFSEENDYTKLKGVTISKLNKKES